jgi:hydroxymethylpyrimidine/phosphomethylpyrimidine kinase
MKGRVLIIAGSDSGGGAGIQADIKSVTALGGYAATAITAITVQNTLGVLAVHDVPLDIIKGQIEAVLSDIGADVVKTGMLSVAPVIDLVVDTLSARGKDIPLVVDPVMVAKGGAALLDPGAVSALKSRLLPMAALVTPNAPEAEALTGLSVQSTADMVVAAQKIAELGPKAVLLKGGHIEGATITDLLYVNGASEFFVSPRIKSASTHGTGCTLASSIACGLAQGMSLRDAVTMARAYVFRAIATAPGLGKGHGPLNHAHPLLGSGLSSGVL